MTKAIIISPEASPTVPMTDTKHLRELACAASDDDCLSGRDWIAAMEAARHVREPALAQGVLALLDEVERLGARLAVVTAARDEACDIAEDFVLGKFYSLGPARTRDEAATRIDELRKVGAK